MWRLIPSSSWLQKKMKLQLDILKEQINTYSVKRSRRIVGSSVSLKCPFPGFLLYTAAEVVGISPRFLVSCLLRCSGFSAAVPVRRERLRGGVGSVSVLGVEEEEERTGGRVGRGSWSNRLTEINSGPVSYVRATLSVCVKASATVTGGDSVSRAADCWVWVRTKKTNWDTTEMRLLGRSSLRDWLQTTEVLMLPKTQLNLFQMPQSSAAGCHLNGS